MDPQNATTFRVKILEKGDVCGLTVIPTPPGSVFITSDVVTRHWFCFQDGGEKVCEQQGKFFDCELYYRIGA